MVTTRRRRRAPEVVEETPSASPEPNVRNIDIEPVGSRRSGSVAHNSQSSSSEPTPPGTPPRTPPGNPPDMPATDRTVRSQTNPSMVSFAGPGQRGAQLLAAASAKARNAYLNSLETLNDNFAGYLRSQGVTLERGMSCFSTHPPGATRIRSTFPYLFTHSRHIFNTHSRPPIPHAFAFSISVRIRVLQIYAFAFFYAFAFPTHSR